MSSSFEKLENWIISSGLCVTAVDDENYGGVHSYYDLKCKEYGFLYPEITGYFLSAIRFLNKFESNETYSKMAEASASWLIQVYKKYGAIIMGIDDDISKQKSAFTFDTAICAKGMIDCYLLTSKEMYLEFADSLINWFLNGVEKDGTIKPYKNLDTGKFMESDDVWYRKKGCLHIKTVIPLIQLSQIKNNTSLLDVAIRICNTYKRFQKSDGSFSMHESSEIVNMHTQCYALEGLLFAYGATKDIVYLESCKKAIDWCVQRIENDGSIRLWYGTKHQSKASYPIAQLIRIMILMDSLHKNSQYKITIDKLSSFLLTMQVTEGKKEIVGGFIEEISKSLFGWKNKERLNSWGSLFALQSLKWYDHYNTINFENSIEYIY